MIVLGLGDVIDPEETGTSAFRPRRRQIERSCYRYGPSSSIRPNRAVLARVAIATCASNSAAVVDGLAIVHESAWSFIVISVAAWAAMRRASRT